MLLDLFDAIGATSSRTQKEELLAQVGELGKRILLATYNPFVTYGLQNISLPDSFNAGSDSDASLEVYFAEFEDLLGELASRRLTGNEARDTTAVVLQSFSPRAAKLLYLVLLKDLNIGITEKTINKVFSGLIPTFEVQLAHDIKGKVDKVKYPVWCDYKLDGQRAILIRDGSQVQLFTRKGHLITAPSGIEEIALRAHVDHFVLDGELMGANWNETQEILGSSVNHKDGSGLFYNVFDFIPFQEWVTHASVTPYQVRRTVADRILQEMSHTRIRLVGGTVVHNPYELKAFYEKALALGHEGIMIKNMDATYQFKRTTDVHKYKPHETWDGTIVVWEQGDPNGNRAGGFGAFLVRFEPGGPVTRVGGGFTEDTLTSINQNLQVNPNAYQGLCIEVKGQEMGKDGKVRFPVYLRMRPDK